MDTRGDTRGTSITTARPHRKRPATAPLPVVALLTPLALAGCGGLGLSGPSSAELALACPKVSIVRDVQEVTHFAGAGRDLTGVVSRAAVADYTGNCEYDDEGVTVNVTLAFLGERGPALKGVGDRYQYFVAVYRPGSQTPANKVVFETGTKFTDEDPRVGWVEQVAPRIPLSKDGNAKDWRVAVGFQLTPDQLAYNRSQIKQGR